MPKNEKAGMLVPAFSLQEFAPATKRIPKKILYGIAVGISVVAGANSCNGP